MNELKEVVSVLSRHKVKQIEVIGNRSSDTKTDSLFERFYEILQLPEIESDEDAMRLLYPGVSNPESTYIKLKNRFRNRLLNTLFFIDVNQPQFTDIQSAFYTCNKKYLAARTLISRGARKAGIKITQKTIREALKFEFTELIVYMAKELAWHYSVVEGNQSNYLKYRNILDNALINLEAETQAEKYHTEIMLGYSKSQASKKSDMLDTIDKYSDNLLTKYPNVVSFRFIRISSLLHITRYQIRGDYSNAIKICKQALEVYRDKPYESRGAEFTINLRLLTCYIQTRNFIEGNEVATGMLNVHANGSRDWYVVNLYTFLLHTHSGQYDRACEIMDSAVSHRGFKNLFAGLKQLWLVNQAYGEFLRSAGYAGESKSKTRFRLYRFLNDMPIYSKDKRGINISILIVHVLFLLNQKKYSEIIDRVDALNQYCHRYLRRDDTFRSNCFIKMLLQMARADFNRIRTERYAQEYLNKLKEVPLDIADQGIEVEVIPYEELWDLAVNLLD